MSSEEKLFNPRTNRYVTKGSTAYRRMVNQDRKDKLEKESKQPKKEEIIKTKSKSKSKSKPKEEVYSSYKEIKERKPDERARDGLTSIAMKVIKDNDDKFRKVRGDQEETDKLLKKLLYEKLARKEKESKKTVNHRPPVKKSRPKSFFDDFDSPSDSSSSSSL